MKHNIMVLALVIFCLPVLGQTKKDLNIDYTLKGQIYAKSSIEDSTAAGSFGSSANFAKQIKDRLLFVETRVFLKIDTTKIVADDSSGSCFA